MQKFHQMMVKYYLVESFRLYLEIRDLFREKELFRQSRLNVCYDFRQLRLKIALGQAFLSDLVFEII